MAVPVGIAAGACGAMLGRVLPIQGLAASRDQRRHRRRRGRGDRRGHGQRTASRPSRTTPRRQSRSRRAAPGGRHGDRGGADQPPELAQRQPQLGVGAGLAGRPRDDAATSVDQLETRRARHYRSRTGAGLGNVEDAAARAGRRTMTAVPIYLPGDPGIGAEEVPADASTTRPSSRRSPSCSGSGTRSPAWLWCGVAGRARLHTCPDRRRWPGERAGSTSTTAGQRSRTREPCGDMTVNDPDVVYPRRSLGAAGDSRVRPCVPGGRPGHLPRDPGPQDGGDEPTARARRRRRRWVTVRKTTFSRH